MILRSQIKEVDEMKEGQPKQADGNEMIVDEETTAPKDTDKEDPQEGKKPYLRTTKPRTINAGVTCEILSARP